MNTVNLVSSRLRRAAVLKAKIAVLEKQLARILGAYGAISLMTVTPAKKSKFSPAALARIRAGQKRRWVKLKALLAEHAG